jgi:hypothetical protein
MDEMDAMERQVASEVAKLMGPIRPVDDRAILGEITAPTVTGRTRSMFSPAKAAIAGALVFGLVGVLLIAQPFGQPDGDLRHAATDSAPRPPVEFTGQIGCDPASADTTGPWVVVREGSTRILDGDFWQRRGHAVQQSATMSDPRLDGIHVVSEDRDEYHSGESPFPIMVAAGTRRIENDEGGWQGSYSVAYLADGSITTFTMPLVGEGAYEGLTALWEEQSSQTSCTLEIRGVIIEGTVPEAPESFIGE